MHKPLQYFSDVNEKHPLVLPIIFFILGIIIASYGWLAGGLSFPVLIVSMLFLTFGILRKWRYNLIFICIIFFLLGAILSTQKTEPPLPNNHIRKVIENMAGVAIKEDNPLGIAVEGVLYSAPERFPDKTRLYVDAEKGVAKNKIIPVSGKILITVGSPLVNVKYGDRVRFIAKLRIPRNFGNPGEFDYAGYLARQGIYVTGYIENERWIAVLRSEQKWALRGTIEQIRDRIRGFIDNSGVDNPSIIKALIIGEQGEIPGEIKESFISTGTAHILAISGLHIVIIAFVSYWIGLQLFRLSERLMLVFNIRKLAALSSIIPILLYGAIAGYPVSTQRAVIMVLVFIIAVLIDREKGLYNTLAAAAFAILILSPLAIYDISFQLSFASVLALIYLVPKLQLFWKDNKEDALVSSPSRSLQFTLHYFKKYFLNPLAVSIAASLGTAPFVTYHFHRVSLIGILANLIVVPLMGFLAVILGLISCIILFFNYSLASIILKLTDITMNISLWIIDLFAKIPYASVYTTTPTILESVLFYLLLICVAEYKKAKIFRYALPLVMLTLGGNYLFWHYRLNYNPNLKVTFISVGQGDSALVEFPYGKRMLIDGGGFYSDNFDVGERIIAPFLWKNKIENVDYIALSHPQADHMKGLRFIAERFSVKEFLWNGDIGEDISYKELIRTIYENNISRSAVDESTPPLDINGVKVEFLNPRHDKRVGWNNDSVVLKLTYKNVGFLFTGDIEDIAEARLLKKGDAIKATVLKVPHHGSRTSSTAEFLKEVNPLVAVVSLGYLNPFGFPHPEILRRYRDLNMPLLRTDTQGAITIETDGMKINYRQKIAGY